jgi:hypothetical protein
MARRKTLESLILTGTTSHRHSTLQLTGIPLEVAAQFPAKWIEERIAALTALQRLGGGEEPLDVHSGPVVYTGAPFPLPECQYTGPTEPTDGQMKADYEKRYGFRVRADGEQLMAVQVTGGTVESVVELTPDGEDL